MTQQSAHDVLEDIKRAMGSCEVQLCIVPLLIGPHKEAVKIRVRNGAGRWINVGPMLFPPGGGSTTDTVAMLMEFREKRGDEHTLEREEGRTDG